MKILSRVYRSRKSVAKDFTRALLVQRVKVCFVYSIKKRGKTFEHSKSIRQTPGTARSLSNSSVAHPYSILSLSSLCSPGGVMNGPLAVPGYRSAVDYFISVPDTEKFILAACSPREQADDPSLSLLRKANYADNPGGRRMRGRQPR